MEVGIFNIQRFSLHDGPGIRTIVFFKGCPLRCAWCSNPESQQAKPVLMYSSRICVGCGSCASACPKGLIAMRDGSLAIERDQCDACGLCAAACPSTALRLSGKTMSLEELFRELKKDTSYYQMSSGGVTLSGGEPFAQGERLLDVLEGLKCLGLGTVVETSGLVPPDLLARSVPLVDQFLFDYKLHDSKKHELCTGVGNSAIKVSLRLLHERNADILLRLPLIPGINMDEEHFDGVCATVNELHINAMEVLPYHQYGKGKYGELGMTYTLNDIVPPEKKTLRQVKKYLATRTRARVL
ncbi:glycyl-radical enzyme activating protein family [Desulfovibrio sp. 3_1_syn3]|uniref:glycyl-radical enzyme activating protein n=1 Tax=Desulfovibrio sp. 3_1_syn3 TaxID=457398 RepID=UPI0001E12765|nr:glycyl-radical enzyme activating protein [Desulfovibrio sp. 3_1_syn3]EFL86110.1 glycyl-radical enzyme activating protein family [Desulfovibrio sp. 3_1_syn3]